MVHIQTFGYIPSLLFYWGGTFSVPSFETPSFFIKSRLQSDDMDTYRLVAHHDSVFTFIQVFLTFPIDKP